MKKLARTGTMATTQDQSSLAKAEPSTPADRGDENAVHPTFLIDFVQPGCTIGMLPVLVALVRSAQPTKQSHIVCASMLH